MGWRWFNDPVSGQPTFAHEDEIFQREVGAAGAKGCGWFLLVLFCGVLGNMLFDKGDAGWGAIGGALGGLIFFASFPKLAASLPKLIFYGIIILVILAAIFD